MKQLILVPLFFTTIALSQSSAIKFTIGKKSPQTKAENAVINHLKTTFKDKEYHGYEFGDLYKITPPEITELENIIDSAKLINPDKDRKASVHYDSLIKLKTKEIKEKHLFSTYEINHFFTLKEKFKNPVLYEYNFELFPDGKIKDAREQMEYKLTPDEYNYYYYYYMRKDLYNDSKQNEALYNYLETLYTNETISKEAAMGTILTVAKVVYEYNVYDTILISRIEVQKWLSKNLKESYTINKYSDVNSIKDTNNNTLGYNLFVELTIKDSTEAYYFEFDYDYILRGILPVKKPFEQYFKKPNEATKNE